MARESFRRVRPFGFRPEIEGLRAVAVLLIVVDALGSAPRAGFIGFDVFFVITGFLITGWLANEHARSGRFSLRGFYERRVRRILPAALIVLAATWVAARTLLSADRSDRTQVDVWWSAGFVANIRFARLGTDSQAEGSSSPVQHFWSIAIAAQFYLFWPLALVVLLWVGRRIWRQRPRAIPTVLAATAVLLLFAFALRLTRSDSTTAYFLTSARAWELGVGAVIALAAPGRVRLPGWFAEASVASGLILVLAAAFLVRADARFPAPDAVAPVAGAALVILGSCAISRTRSALVLTNPALRYVGRISYSLYLWHWPVLVFLEARYVGSRPYLVGICVLLTAALSVASFHFVESPMRHAELSARAVRRRMRSLRELPRWRTPGVSERAYAALAAFSCAVASLVVWQLQPYRSVPALPPATGNATAPTAIGPFGEVEAPPNLVTAIDRALAAGTFPRLRPSLDELPDAKVPEWRRCGNVSSSNLPRCTFPATAGTSNKTVAVIGDSVGITWLPAVRGLQDEGYTVYGLTFGQCPAADLSVTRAAGNDTGFTERCNAHRRWAIRMIGELRSDVVVLANSLETVRRLASGVEGVAAYDEWRDGTASTISNVRAQGVRRIALIAPPPPGPSLQSCAISPTSAPSDCVSRVSSLWAAVTNVEREVAESNGVTYIDVRRLFCATNDLCPSFVGTMPVRQDGVHLTEVYSKRLAPILGPLIIGSRPVTRSR